MCICSILCFSFRNNVFANRNSPNACSHCIERWLALNKKRTLTNTPSGSRPHKHPHKQTLTSCKHALKKHPHKNTLTKTPTQKHPNKSQTHPHKNTLTSRKHPHKNTLTKTRNKDTLTNTTSQTHPHKHNLTNITSKTQNNIRTIYAKRVYCSRSGET